MKKIISVLLAVSVAGSLAVCPVSAGEYPDYIPTGEKSPNILLTDQGANTSVPRNFRAGSKATDSTKIGFAVVDTADWVTAAKNYREQKLTAKANITKNADYGYEGVFMSTANDFFSGMERLTPGESYVISFKAKSVGKNSANLGVAVSNGTADTVTYSADYGYGGIPLTDEYQTVGTAIKVSDSFDSEKDNVITVGFPDGTAAGEEIYFGFEDINSVYFGKEVAYDIENTLVSEEYQVCQDEEFLVDAKVLNQVGTAGNLNQELSWIAMNKDKTEEVPGFTFTSKKDGLTGVYASEDVAEGEYALVAVSDEYEGFMKTLYITLNPKRIADSSPSEGEEEPENMLKNPASVGQYKETSATAVTKGKEYWTVKAKNNISGEYSVEGLEIRTIPAFGFGFTGDFEAGKNYGVKAKVRKSAVSSADDVKFSAFLGQGEENTYSKTENISLSDEWQDITVMLAVSENCTEGIEDKKFILGMPEGTEQGSAFDIMLETVFVAPEVFGGAEIEISECQMPLVIGDEITVTAGNVNQFGFPIEGYSQKFQWYVLNELRNDYVDEIKLDINEESNKVNIKIDEFIKSGIYYIVAEQDTDDGITRLSVSVTVKTPVLWEYIAEVIKNEDSDKLSENILLYAKALEITGSLSEVCDKATATEILLNDVDEISSEEELIKMLKRALAVSLFVKNPNGASLAVESEMGIEDIDKDGVTVAKLFSEYLSEEGKNALRNELSNGDYTSFEDFKKPFAKAVMLNTIGSPLVKGTGYVGEVLTVENSELAGIDISSYTASSYKSEINKLIARKSYTEEGLIEAIKSYKPSTNKGGSSSGGGGSKAPSTSVSVAPVIPEPEKEDGKTENVAGFEDVSEKHWAYSDIYHLKARGIVSGDENNRFNPDDSLTREQFVKMICEVFEYPITDKDVGFTDVKKDAWYAGYVNTVAENKIIEGVGNNVFGTGKTITRQDLCVIVYRAMGVSDEISDQLTFSDAELISDYAKQAVLYLNLYGVVSGFEDGSFRPEDKCTRAQAAKILCKILDIKAGIEE